MLESLTNDFRMTTLREVTGNSKPRCVHACILFSYACENVLMDDLVVSYCGIYEQHTINVYV